MTTNQEAYPEPTVIMIDENTNISESINELSKQPKRTLVGLMLFNTPDEFENWQRETPREIFEINVIHQSLISVTYNKGLIGGW